MSEKNYPDAIINTPSNKRALSRVFSYDSRSYDLNAYEAILPGGGERIWNMYTKAQQHEVDMEMKRQKLEDATGRTQPPIRRPFW